jgi:hypothetical protein
MSKRRPSETVLAAFYSIVLVWINFYIVREIFHSPAGSMPSMHGFWIALAARAQGSWFHPTWWPYWNCGMPFEYAYAPLIPALTATWAAIRHVSGGVGFNAVTGIVYIAAPLMLFLMAWMITRAPGYSFFAALLYSLTSVAQVIVPDSPWSPGIFWQSWRFTVTAIWDDTPHLAAVALLPPAVVLLWRSVTRPSWWLISAAAALIALATYASVFAPISIGIAAIALIAAVDAPMRARLALRIAGVAVLAYALAAAFLPPSLIAAIADSAHNGPEPTWTVESFTAIALMLLGWIALWPFVQRIRVAYLRFFVLFAYLTSAIPILGIWLHRSFLPQPKRYAMEMEMALCLLIVFGLRPWIDKLRPSLRVALALVALCLAGEQIASHRRFAKAWLNQPDVQSTIEYRTAKWAERNLPGVRLMLPGSIAQWAADFAPIDQLSGGSWSLDSNPSQRLAMSAVEEGGRTPSEDARISLAWLKAFGVGAIAMDGPNSQEFWKPYAHPQKFDGVLPVLWSEDGVTFFRIPQRSASLSHIIPRDALVRAQPRSILEIGAIDRYDAALDDPALPESTLQWMDRNHIRIAGRAQPGQVISIQVSYHPGWHASAGGREIPVHRDGLGLIWLDPQGAPDIELEYTGGAELRICRGITLIALAALFAIPLLRRRRQE